MVTSDIDFELCKELFKKQVQVRLDWHKLQKSLESVDLRIVTKKSEMKNWYFPWYMNQNKEVSYIDPSGYPIRISSIRKKFDHLSAVKRSRIRKLKKAFESSRIVSFPLLTYFFDENKEIVLDGNHRLCGAILSNRKLTLPVFRIFGPQSGDILPDLMKIRPS